MRTLVKWGAMGLALAVLLTTGAAFAQTTTGNIFGQQVVDEQGAPLPGATVTVSRRRRATDDGHRRTRRVPVPGLSIGAYQLTASLGFSTVEQANVSVGAGRSTTVGVRAYQRGDHRRDHGDHRDAADGRTEG